MPINFKTFHKIFRKHTAQKLKVFPLENISMKIHRFSTAQNKYFPSRKQTIHFIVFSTAAEDGKFIVVLYWLQLLVIKSSINTLNCFTFWQYFLGDIFIWSWKFCYLWNFMSFSWNRNVGKVSRELESIAECGIKFKQ